MEAKMNNPIRLYMSLDGFIAGLDD